MISFGHEEMSGNGWGYFHSIRNSLLVYSIRILRILHDGFDGIYWVRTSYIWCNPTCIGLCDSHAISDELENVGNS